MSFLCLAAGLSCFSSRFGFPVSLHRSDYVSVHLLYVLTDSTAIIRKRSVTFLSSDFLNIRKSDQGISLSDIEVNIGERLHLTRFVFNVCDH